MRVALISFDFGEYSVRLASALAEHATVLLLLNELAGAPFTSQLDTRVIRIPIPRVRHRQVFRQIRRNRWILRQLRDFGPDVIHVQQGSMWFNIALRFAHTSPLVLTVHDAQRHPGDKLSRKTPYFFSKMGFRRADRIIAHNHYVKTLLQTELGLAKEKVDVIPHIQLGQGGFDGGVACGDEVDDGRTVLFFGRIWQYKGLDYLIRAEDSIADKMPDIRIVIAGQGEDFERYRRLMLHPERFVVLNHHIDDVELAMLFRQASVVVLPYIEASQSGVIPIAYTYGKPVVATTVGGLPEMIEDGVTGLLVPPKDERRLAAAILAVLGDDLQRRRMGDAAKRKIQRECSPEVIARKTFDVYRTTLSLTFRPCESIAASWPEA